MTGVARLISRNRPRGGLSKCRSALARGTLAQRAAPRLVQLAACGLGSGPAAGVLCDESGKESGVCVAGVEGGNVVVELATALQEQRAIANRNFLQRLEAVGCKSRAHDADASLSCARHLHERLIRIGAQPFFASDLRLKAHAPCAGFESEPLRDEPRALEALAVIRIAREQIAAWHSMK